jgi:hypothetical protein
VGLVVPTGYLSPSWPTQRSVMGPFVIRAEKRSGTTTGGRVNRAWCSASCESDGASLKLIEKPIDTATTAGKCFLDRRAP